MSRLPSLIGGGTLGAGFDLSPEAARRRAFLASPEADSLRSPTTAMSPDEAMSGLLERRGGMMTPGGYERAPGTQITPVDQDKFTAAQDYRESRKQQQAASLSALGRAVRGRGRGPSPAMQDAAFQRFVAANPSLAMEMVRQGPEYGKIGADVYRTNVSGMMNRDRMDTERYGVDSTARTERDRLASGAPGREADAALTRARTRTEESTDPRYAAGLRAGKIVADGGGTAAEISAAIRDGMDSYAPIGPPSAGSESGYGGPASGSPPTSGPATPTPYFGPPSTMPPGSIYTLGTRRASSGSGPRGPLTIVPPPVGTGTSRPPFGVTPKPGVPGPTSMFPPIRDVPDDPDKRIEAMMESIATSGRAPSKAELIASGREWGITPEELGGYATRKDEGLIGSFGTSVDSFYKDTLGLPFGFYGGLGETLFPKNTEDMRRGVRTAKKIKSLLGR